MRKVYVTGQNGEIIKHSRAEEDAFTRMVLRVRRQFSFCQFQYRMTLIVETKFTLNFCEDSFAIIMYHYVGVDSGFRYSEVNASTARVVDSIVQGFSKSIMPNVNYIVRQGTDERSDIRTPDHILR